MIYGIGVDIIEIARIDEFFKKRGDKFVRRILTVSERKIFEERYEKNHDRGIAFLAKRFAGKEAISKALGQGIGSDASFQDVEILNNQNGSPIVFVKGKEDMKFKISLSDSRDNAVAYVIVEK